MAVNKVSYPSSSTTALTCTLAALASDTGLVIGRASTAIDNTTNLDLDHFVTGSFTTGTTPTVSTNIEVWAYAPRSLASNVPTYSDSITGTDAAKTMSSLNVKYGALRLVASLVVDATTNRVYDFPPTSIANLFGAMPPFWGIFVVHNNVAALSAGALQYLRVQSTTV